MPQYVEAAADELVLAVPGLDSHVTKTLFKTEMHGHAFGKFATPSGGQYPASPQGNIQKKTSWQ